MNATFSNQSVNARFLTLFKNLSRFYASLAVNFLQDYLLKSTIEEFSACLDCLGRGFAIFENITVLKSCDVHQPLRTRRKGTPNFGFQEFCFLK